MAALTETEIFSCLTENLRDAAANCDLLAQEHRKGPTYRKLRTNLQLIEGAARQMGFFRFDMRYQVLALKAAEAHKRAGDWLRSHTASTIFFKLAEAMRQLERDLERLRHARTGRSRPILVPPQAPPHRTGRPVAVPANFQQRGSLLVPA